MKYGEVQKSAFPPLAFSLDVSLENNSLLMEKVFETELLSLALYYTIQVQERGSQNGSTLQLLTKRIEYKSRELQRKSDTSLVFDSLVRY